VSEKELRDKIAAQLLKAIFIIWILISGIAYLVSGNLTVFYAFGIIFFIGGIPYYAIYFINRKKKE
jgi:hypothetical protein